MEVPKQYKVNVRDDSSKIHCVKNIILDPGVGQTIIYVHTEETARMLHEELKDPDFRLRTLRLSLDAADTQENRDKEHFEQKRFQVLISTKILDWVFDQSQDGLVVFFDLSILGSSSQLALEQYSRCIGKGGAVYNLVCGDMDKKMMETIERHNNVTEVGWKSDLQFEDAFKARLK